MKTLKNVRTHDAPVRIRRTHIIRDAKLSAINPGKLCVRGRVWDGIAEFIDVGLEAMLPITSAFTLGRTLNAEPSSATMDLGRTWVGNLQKKLQVARDSQEETTGAPDVDVSGVMQAVDDLCRQMGTASPSAQAVADSLTRLKRARDSVCRTTWQARAKDNAAKAFAQIRTTAAHLTARTTGTHDRAGDVRDHVAQIRRATDARSMGDHINAANRALWATHDAPPSEPPAHVRSASGLKSAAEINGAAAAFWKGQ